MSMESHKPKTVQLVARVPENYVSLLDDYAAKQTAIGRDMNRSQALRLVLSHGLLVLNDPEPKRKR